MTWLILKRISRAIMTVFLVSLIIFVLIRIVPGDPTRTLVSGTAPDSAVEELRKQLGLDKPILVQYGYFFIDAKQGDLGHSFFRNEHGGTGQSVGGSAKSRMEATKGEGTEGLKSIEEKAFKKAPVTNLIYNRIGITLKIILGSLILAVIISLAFSIISLINKKIASFFEIFTVFIGALPIFWVAIIFMLILSVYLKVLPGVGISSWKSYILPVVVLSLMIIPSAYKKMFESLKQITNEKFIIALKERGMPKIIILKHVIKHFITSIITFIGLQFGPLFGGVFIVE